MGLRRLELRRFRNLGAQTLEFPPEGAAIIGDNAQGKSNLLESIYYLETFRSFRGARDGQLVEFDSDVFRVVGDVEREPDRVRRVAAAFKKSGRRKKVTVDGVEAERLGDAIGSLGAVVFSPADIGIISDGPLERRRFLDIVLSLNSPGYLEALQRFKHVLTQRNAALREERPAAVVRAWDGALVENGSAVIAARRGWVSRWGTAFDAYHRTISGGRRASMEYAGSVDQKGPDPAEGATKVASDGEVEVSDVTATYHEALMETGDRERRVGNTVVGPHRDDIAFTVEGVERSLDVRAFGSGGQRRTAALALRLVEADTIRESRGREPMILLDDVLAELDPGRGERILELLDREGNQVILTAPKESDVRIRRDRLPRWSIRDGRVGT